MPPLSRRPEQWLWSLLALSLVLPIGLFGLIAWQTWLVTLRVADQQMAGTVRLLRENTEKVLDTDELAAGLIDRLTAGLSWSDIAASATVHQQLQVLDEQLPQVHGLFLVAPDGTIANSSSVFPMPSVNVRDRDYFVALRGGPTGDYIGGAYIGGVYVGRTSGAVEFNFALRRSSRDRSFNGVIDVSDDPAYFQEIYRGVADVGAEVFLARTDGRELASYPDPSGPDSRIAPPVARLAAAQHRVLTGIADRAHNRRSAYVRVHDYPLIIGYSLPEREITRRWLEAMAPNAVLIGTGWLLIALTSWLALLGFRREAIAHASFRAEVQRREAAEAQARQAQKMEAVGQLAAGMAHDFNNLLAVITSNLELLQRRAAEAERPRIEAALAAVGRGARLVRHMLSFARRQVLHPEPRDVAADLTALAPLLRSALTPGTHLDYDLDGPATAVIDQTEFELAVLNIATNAGHAMPEAGRFRVELRLVSVPTPDGAPQELAAGRYVRIAFSDTGQGMPAETVARAFEPFFTTRSGDGGTGLGLSQVYGFASQAGGLATLESAPGRGTTVTLYLPVAAAGAAGRPA
ncbi:MAG TPA: ATP-binding protein [Acetobacteraceae bacterium]|nr:ATP-binding protein [Acetobacteraceae bacterium]